MYILNDVEAGKCKMDFHLHTTNSDGEQNAEDVIKQAKQNGLSRIAITDHNTFTYTVPFMYENMMVLPGIELSAEYYVPAWGESTEIHIISIFPDGVNPEDFKELLSGIETGREEYVEAILKDLETRGIHITMDEVRNIEHSSKAIGRHEIAKVLVKKGLEKNIDAAFDHQIGNFSPYYISATRYIHYASMKDVVTQVINSGGLPILAHPYGYSMSEEEIEQLIIDFKSIAGLESRCKGTKSKMVGMEVYYERYLTDEHRMSFLKEMQEKYELFASAGSDRHREDQPFGSCGNYLMFEIMMQCLTLNQLETA